MGNASFVLQQISQILTARECLQEIMSASNRAADLCRQMLAYAGKGKMIVQSIDLSSTFSSLFSPPSSRGAGWACRRLGVSCKATMVL